MTFAEIFPARRETLADAAWRALLEGLPAPDAPALYRAIAEAEVIVIGQVGQSLDGRVANTSGDCAEVSGPEGMRHLHRLRALCDAVIIGAETAVRDDPRLSVREVSGPNPARVVIDPRGRVPATARLFADDGSPRIVFQACDAPRPPGVIVVRLDAGTDGLCTQNIVTTLRGMGLKKLLVEGGACTLGHFLQGGLLDRLHVGISQILIGSGPAGIAFPSAPSLRLAMRPAVQVYDLGGDVVFDCVFAGAAGQA